MSVKKLGPGGASGVSKTKGKSTSRTGSASGAGFADFVKGGTASEEAQGATGLSGVTGIESLLSLQEVDAEAGGGRHQKARQQGEDILNKLEMLRLSILEGRVAPHVLQGIAQAVKQRQGKTGDELLDEILEDISLRAEIELAKLGL